MEFCQKWSNPVFSTRKFAGFDVKDVWTGGFLWLCGRHQPLALDVSASRGSRRSRTRSLRSPQPCKQSIVGKVFPRFGRLELSQHATDSCDPVLRYCCCPAPLPARLTVYPTVGARRGENLQCNFSLRLGLIRVSLFTNWRFCLKKI